LWKKAIEAALSQTKVNIASFGDLFPHVGSGEVYEPIPNHDWTNGFWSGILWLSYQYSGDKEFQLAANRTVDSFRKRMDLNVQLDHHDIGFLYSLSAKAQWILEKNEEAKSLALRAAETLYKRWRAKGEYIQAWGSEGDPDNGGRIIIDCLLNLPLLYWASEITGDTRFKEIAEIHADKSRRFLVRGDDSSYHTFYFNQETGEAIRGGTAQGYQDGSTWTRGQAWGIYGFALSYRYTKNPLYLETAKRLARYFLEHLPEDSVAYWDFDAPVNAELKRDSSASAIAACGILEMLSHLDPADKDCVFFAEGVHRSMKSLVESYAVIGQKDAQGFLRHGSYSVRGGVAPDDYMIWGDYFYLEALLRLEKGFTGYWYE
jgi:unsaturated chondroitin disaccharide hydrolase